MTLIDSARETELQEPAGSVDAGQVVCEAEATVPTRAGVFTFRGYRDVISGQEHLAIISGTPVTGALVRVHSECLTGEAFGSLKCECGPQLDVALKHIAQHDGVVIYMRGHEGRGIGLNNKLRAYRLQESGLDTLDANLELGLPDDARDYTAAGAILADLGLTSITLLTNNPDKIEQLQRNGIKVVDREPLVVGVEPENRGYLEAKKRRMGHLLAI